MCQALGKSGNMCHIFNVKGASGSIMLEEKSRKAGFHRWTQKKKDCKSASATVLAKIIINQYFHNKVNVHLTCLICYANAVSESPQLCELCTYCTFKWKDTVSTRKQSSSSEEFCHYTSHWPNIHWKTEEHHTNVKICSSNNSSVMMYRCRRSPRRTNSFLTENQPILVHCKYIYIGMYVSQ